VIALVVRQYGWGVRVPPKRLNKSKIMLDFVIYYQYIKVLKKGNKQ